MELSASGEDSVGAIWRLVRIELRARRGRFLAVAVLIGLAGGLALGVAAGARRTDTSFTRMLQRYPGPDVIVPNIPDPSGGTAVFDAAMVNGIPGVEIVAETKPFVSIIGGQPTVNVAHVDESLGSATTQAFKIVEGRQPDQTRLDEAIGNYVAVQRLHLHVGELVPLELVPPFTELLAHPGIELPASVRIVGLYAGPSEIFSEEQTIPALHLSAAFARLFPPFTPSSLLVSLRDGPGGVPAFLSELESRAQGLRVQVLPAHRADRDKQRAIHTEAASVWVLAGLLAVTAMLVVTQTLVRQASLRADEDRVLAVLGVTRRQLWTKTMLQALAVLVVGATFAVGLMYLMSPLLPVGIARIAEPHPGFAFDSTVALLGSLVLVVGVLAAISVPALVLSRSTAREPKHNLPGTGSEPARRSWWRRASSRGPLSLTLGAALTLDRRKGRHGLPLFTTVGSMSAAIAGLTAAVVFAASLSHVLGTPRLYGLTWDAAVGGSTTDVRSAASPLREDPRVEGLAFGVTGVGFRIAGQAVDAELIDPPVKGSTGAVVLEGRAPLASGEIALGSRTMRELHLHVGDVVDAGLSGSVPGPMRVVGRIVLQPANSGPQTSFQTATALRLGDGALATYSGTDAASPGVLPPAQAFVRFAPGVDHTAVLAELVHTIGGDAGPTTFTPPLDIIAFGQVKNLPMIFAGLLGAVAFATLMHMLLAVGRRRARDLAILRSLGLARRDIVLVVVWQACLLAAIALAVGSLVGIIGGRWLWIALVDGAGIVAEPSISPLALVGGAVAVECVAAVVALVPGMIAARVKPAVVLATQ
ncbi:MAG: FtsX-like permease family protein [Acidimicrobiales bacterium]